MATKKPSCVCVRMANRETARNTTFTEGTEAQNVQYMMTWEEAVIAEMP
jgi:hypothetical protein